MSSGRLSVCLSKFQTLSPRSSFPRRTPFSRRRRWCSTIVFGVNTVKHTVPKVTSLRAIELLEGHALRQSRRSSGRVRATEDATIADVSAPCGPPCRYGEGRCFWLVIYQSLHPGHSCCSPVTFPGSCCSCSPLLGLRFYDRDVVKSIIEGNKPLCIGRGHDHCFPASAECTRTEGRGPIGGRLEPSLYSVDTWANAQDGRKLARIRRAVGRGPKGVVWSHPTARWTLGQMHKTVDKIPAVTSCKWEYVVGQSSQGRGLERPQSELWAVAPMGSFRAIPQLGGHLGKCSRGSPTPSGDEPKTGNQRALAPNGVV